ncbi:unnamed protein product [Spirodela intermedia]|uniref:Uncharacterized protein n=1 Tax=Spirodela intermedia TaxID=51605 RepID=A0A7I8IGQ4_SPIIN|nr:unnamed protein product [Spirodela intermedia]CAA6657050.1 unnamed protein product [Spirodela intermedia]
MGRRVVSGGCHPAERKNGDFASSPAAVTRRSGKTVTLRLSGDCHPMERNWMEVGRVLGSFILRELHPQVHTARGGSSSHLVCSQEVKGLALKCNITIYSLENLAHKRYGTKPDMV